MQIVLSSGCPKCGFGRRDPEGEEQLAAETAGAPPSYSECVNNNAGTQVQRSDSRNTTEEREAGILPPAYHVVTTEQYLEITHPVKSELERLKRFSETLLDRTQGSVCAFPQLKTQSAEGGISHSARGHTNCSMVHTNHFSEPGYENYGFTDDETYDEITPTGDNALSANPSQQSTNVEDNCDHVVFFDASLDNELQSDI